MHTPEGWRASLVLLPIIPDQKDAELSDDKELLTVKIGSV
jgi:hypothetical protein